MSDIPDDDDDVTVTAVPFAAVGVEKAPAHLIHVNNCDDKHGGKVTEDGIARMTAMAEMFWPIIVECPECLERFQSTAPRTPSECFAWLPYLVTQVQLLTVRLNSATDEITRLLLQTRNDRTLFLTAFRTLGVELHFAEQGEGSMKPSDIDNIDVSEHVREAIREKLREMGALGPDKKKTN